MDINLIEKLCMINGTSGDEKDVRNELISLLPADCEYTVDALGNLIVNKKGKRTPKKKVALFAHMDEVGFIVTYITDDGYVRVAPVGGMDDSALFGKRVTVNGVNGVAGGKAIHLCSGDEGKKIPKITDMTLDFGFENKEQAEEKVALGDFVYFKSDFVCFGDGFVKSKALDDRIGTATLINILNEESDFDYTCVFTVQEEIGTRGATVSAYTVKPDYAIVLETTTASDIADTPDHKKVCKVSGGAVVSFMDRGTLYDRELYKKAFETAEKNGIPCQTKTVVAGGNDSSAIHKAAGGIKTVAVSVPCRYIHSPSSVCSEKDIDSVERLAKALLRELADA